MRFFNESVKFTQKQKALNLATLVVFVISTLSGLMIQELNLKLSVFTTVVASCSSLLILLLNRRGHFFPGAILLCVVMYLTILVIALEGFGLWDVSLVAYPFFIAAGSLFFGRKSVKFFVLSVIVAFFIIYFVQQAGYIRTVVVDGAGGNLQYLLLIITSCSFILWYFVNSRDESLKRAQDSETSLIEAYDSTLAGWVKALEYRNKETEEHSRRVVEMTVRLARVMGVAEKDLIHYRRGALLHDIGKLTTPDSILLKKSSLAPQEMEVMRRHPLVAGEMLSSIGFLSQALDIPVYHHEHWDGSGYPYGLKGEEIPFAARIFSVVDSWEALGAHRAYRDAWPQEKVIDYLVENKGILFDPQVVDAFLPLAQSGETPEEIAD